MFDKKKDNNYETNDYSYLLIYKILAKKLFSMHHLFTMLGAIATTLLFSQSVLAQSFAGYCIVQKNDENLEQETRTILSQYEDSPSITVNKGDLSYVISVDETNKRKLILKQEGESLVIGQMTLSQEGGQIKNLTLGEDNWLWIDRNAIDYVMKINFGEKTSSFDPPLRLPELSAQPCHLIRRLLKKCHHGEYSYSSSLNRVFVSGYPTKSWRKNSYIHLEFIAGEEEPVPELLAQAIFIADVPEWKGALFRDISGEALFYDGTKVINLSQDFLQLKDGENFQNWDIKETAGGRRFLGNFSGRTDEEPLFLLEFKAKPGFKPVYLPEDFNNNKWLELVTVPQDPNRVLWIITRKAIFAEVKRRVQTIVGLPPSFFITRLKPDSLASVKENDSSILFTVQKDQTKISQDYFLQTMSANYNCETIVDLEQPIILKQP